MKLPYLEIVVCVPIVLPTSIPSTGHCTAHICFQSIYIIIVTDKTKLEFAFFSTTTTGNQPQRLQILRVQGQLDVLPWLRLHVRLQGIGQVSTQELGSIEQRCTAERPVRLQARIIGNARCRMEWSRDLLKRIRTESHAGC